MTDELEVGDRAIDRESPPGVVDPVIVVSKHEVTAEWHAVESLGKTVYQLNQRYGYPSGASVVSVAYEPALDEAAAGWRRKTPDNLPTICMWCDVETYKFPVPRLQKIESETEVEA